MVLKVGAGIPLVWRNPSSLQFGVDTPIVVLDALDSGTERLVAALVSGVSRSGFDMMAREAGLTEADAVGLLDRLEPVLQRGADAPAGTVAVTGDGALADELRRVLASTGELAAPGDAAPELAVLVAAWVIGVDDHGTWLRRDIPHLPVVIGDGGVTVGPFVEPGSGPCLYCVQLTRTDEDAAWPAIATQLWSRPAPSLARLPLLEAAAFTARRIHERLDGGPSSREEATSWQLDARDGAVSSRGWMPHAHCRCATPAEIDWAPAAALSAPPSTRRDAGGASPA
jgi:bacteriocin biosynthesis cyclodehydratase domain-containing protein